MVVCFSRHFPDHPRSRGVYARPVAVRTRQEGSSPLARGLRVVSDLKPFVSGIIPARAGFTSLCIAMSRWIWDHPRSRGVYDGAQVIENGRSGSSPLARGLHGAGFLQERFPGIIPARAGFTPLFTISSLAIGDHPRSRGVYPGSGPPHIRAARIIPARAGFTRDRSALVWMASDHPRSRGVYQSALNDLASATGSSPLARGLRRPDRPGCRYLRIIPARAGFTRQSAGRRRPVPDHPRSRGVYLSGDKVTHVADGSSPLARGLPQHTKRRS